MLRQRATLRDLRLGNVGVNAADAVESEQKTDFEDQVSNEQTLERPEFYAELDQLVEQTDLHNQTLTLFAIHFDYVGTDEQVSQASGNTEKIAQELVERINAHDTEIVLSVNHTERKITGFFVDDEVEQSSETIVGAFLKDFAVPVKVEDQWLLLETRAACVTLNELKDQTTRSLVDALDLTLGSTTTTTSFLVYKPYLKTRQTREVLIQEVLSQHIENEMITLLFEDIKSAATGKTVGIEIISSFSQAEIEESPYTDSDLLTAATRSPLAFELGECTRRLGTAAFQNEIKPGLNSRLLLWFNISAAQLANPRLLDSLKELNLPAGNIGLEVSDHKILETEVAQKKLQVIKANGFSLALDDLKITSPRLAMIARLPFDTLKLNIADTISASNTIDSAAQLGYLSSLVDGLNIKITMTGITSASQAKEARRLGATSIQGNYSDKSEDSIELG